MDERLMVVILSLLGAYLLGGIPFGYLVGRARGVDVRTVGSKNIGATNVFRTVGKKWGLLAFACDVLKGFLPVFVAKRFLGGYGDCNLALYVGVVAVLGHMLTPYIADEKGRRFHGGKGVATTLGMLLGLIPALVGAAFLLFAIVFALSHYISLGSCLAALALAVAIWFPVLGSAGVADIPQCVLVTLLAAFIVFKHRSNLLRLREGRENKIYLTKGNKS